MIYDKKKELSKNFGSKISRREWISQATTFGAISLVGGLTLSKAALADLAYPSKPLRLGSSSFRVELDITGNDG